MVEGDDGRQSRRHGQGGLTLAQRGIAITLVTLEQRIIAPGVARLGIGGEPCQIKVIDPAKVGLNRQGGRGQDLPQTDPVLRRNLQCGRDFGQKVFRRTRAAVVLAPGILRVDQTGTANAHDVITGGIAVCRENLQEGVKRLQRVCCGGQASVNENDVPLSMMLM